MSSRSNSERPKTPSAPQGHGAQAGQAQDWRRGRPDCSRWTKRVEPSRRIWRPSRVCSPFTSHPFSLSLSLSPSLTDTLPEVEIEQERRLCTEVELICKRLYARKSTSTSSLTPSSSLARQLRRPRRPSTKLAATLDVLVGRYWSYLQGISSTLSPLPFLCSSSTSPSSSPSPLRSPSHPLTLMLTPLLRLPSLN